MDPILALRKRRGAARRESLLAAGVTRGKLARAVADGAVTRPLYGVYALPGTPLAPVLRAAYRAELACTSMCAAFGLPVIEDDARSHLWVPRNRARRADDRRPREGVVLHRHDHEARGDRGRIAIGLDLMGICHGRLAQLVAIDAALNRGYITRDTIAAFTHTETTRVTWLLARSDSRAQSPLETITRVTLVEAGFEVRPQAPIAGLGHVDMLVDGALIVETDGKAHHDNPSAWREDLRRNNAATLAGYPTLRFTYADVMFDRAGMVGKVRRALGH